MFLAPGLNIFVDLENIWDFCRFFAAKTVSLWWPLESIFQYVFLQCIWAFQVKLVPVEKLRVTAEYPAI